MLDQELLEFIGGSIRSVWSLELLLLLRREPRRTWSADELVRELRASPTLVGDVLSVFEASGLVSGGEADQFAYAPAAPVIGALADRLERTYRQRPGAVVRAIVATPSDKLQTFANAFRIKDDPK